MTGLHKLRLVAAVAIGSFVAVSASAFTGAHATAGRSAGETAADAHAVTYGVIEGVVVDDHGQPLAGAVVSAIGPTAALAVTDATGHFILDELPSGSYQLRARKLGRSPSDSLTVDLQDHPRVRARLALTGPAPTADAATSELQYPILAAGFAPLPEEAGADGTSGSAGETAWRLRHLRRSVLKDAEGQVTAVADASGSDRRQGIEAFLDQSPLAGRTAGFLDDLSGQINLLTVGSFDNPQQIFSADGFSHGVAYLSIHSAPAGHSAWSVRGAMTEGDFASWVLSGAYVARAGDNHRYEVGMFYGAQRPDRSSALATSQVLEGGRDIGSVHADDLWTVSPHVALAYGADYVRYDYAGGRGLLDPRATLTLTPGAGSFRIRATASRQSLAPGSEELMLPTADGIWLPPQHAFAVLAPSGQLKPERTEQYQVGIEHDMGRTSTVGVEAFYQRVNDQFVTLFGLGPDAAAEATRYFVADSGNVTARGWSVHVAHAITHRVRGTVDYTVSTAEWVPGTDAAMLATLAPAAARNGTEHLQDLSTSLETDIPETATHVLMLYRINTGFADRRGAGQPGLGYRFDVRVTQGLPFLDFSGTQWQALVAVRNFFRDTAVGGSTYDELLVIRPPKRIVGGIMLRF